MGRPKADKPRSEITNVRLTEDEKISFETHASDLGFTSLSEYIRYMHNQTVQKAEQSSNIENYKARWLVTHRPCCHCSKIGLLRTKLHRPARSRSMRKKPHYLQMVGRNGLLWEKTRPDMFRQKLVWKLSQLFRPRCELVSADSGEINRVWRAGARIEDDRGPI